MNDTELDKLLKSVRSPSRPADYWETFPHRISLALNRPRRKECQIASWLHRLAWTGGFSAICVLMAFLIGHRVGQNQPVTSNGNTLQNEKLIREVLTMFPNRVQAIVKNEAGLHLVLSDSADVPDNSTLLWIEVCHGKQCTTLVTFSGQEVEVANQRVTVLEEADSGILLVGENFAWASDDTKKGLFNLRIQAKPLTIAMR